MGLIKWDDSFSVGVRDIDHEHKQLISLINELYQSLDNDLAKDEVVKYFGEIYSVVAAHFALEEKFMRDANYDEYRAHKAEHEALLDDIRDLMDEYEQEVCFDKEELTRRLGSWFGKHFRETDARLHRHFVQYEG